MKSILPFASLLTSCVFIDSYEHEKNISSVENAEFNDSKYEDNDEDGFPGAEDCDDEDPSVALMPECDDIDIHFSLIEPEYFYMGSEEDSIGHESDEVRHSVILRRNYFIMDTEFTKEQFAFYNDEELDNQETASTPVTGLMGRRRPLFQSLIRKRGIEPLL